MKSYEPLSPAVREKIEDLTAERDFLQDQIHELCYALKVYEDQLRRIMTPKEFAAFSKDMAQDLFKRSVEDMEECEFKNFCRDLIERWKA